MEVAAGATIRKTATKYTIPYATVRKWCEDGALETVKTIFVPVKKARLRLDTDSSTSGHLPGARRADEQPIFGDSLADTCLGPEEGSRQSANGSEPPTNSLTIIVDDTVDQRANRRLPSEELIVEINLDDLALGLIGEGIKSMVAIYKVAQDPQWIRQQRIGDLALFLATASDRISRFIAAMRPASEAQEEVQSDSDDEYEQLLATTESS